jgi:Ankyrin repeats (3 copies)
MTVPLGIDLDQYKTQAKELLKGARAGLREPLARLREHRRSDKIHLADAQLVIARENGFPSWARFKEYLLFRNAVKALDSGDLPRLQALLNAHPSLIRYRCRVGDWYEKGYFAGATLLYHVAGNPDRGPLPRNILDVARLLLSRDFDRKAAEYTIGLLLTSKRASEAGVAMPLIDLLLKAGAQFDLDAPDVLGMPLLNVAPATAEALVLRGAKMDIRHAAALGKIEVMQSQLAETVTPAMLEEALAFACIRGQVEAAALLSKQGARGDVLVTPGGQTPRTALHEAANRGHADIVKILLVNGANAFIVEPCWSGTPAGWAEHGEHPEIAAMLRNFT